MARRTTTTSSGGRGGAGNSGIGTDEDAEFEENIVDIDVTDEMRGSYLEYAYSVIYSLPDERDGPAP
jgi:DNA gyrase subunit A